MSELITTGWIDLGIEFPPTTGVRFRIAEAANHVTRAGHRALRVTFEAVVVPSDASLVGHRIAQTILLEGRGAAFARPFFAALGITTGGFKLGDLLGKQIVADVAHQNWQGATWERVTNFRVEIDTTEHEFTLGSVEKK